MKRIQNALLFFFLLLLPTQFGKHFFGDFSFINGVAVDYLSIVLYITDILVFMLALLHAPLLKKTLFENKNTFIFFCILFFLNGLFSINKLLSAYHALKYLELYIVFIIFKKTKLSSSIALTALTIGASVELCLSIAQLYLKSSVQGLFYFVGERMMSVQTPDVAKASLQGVEFLRSYGTFSHPNSMAGFYVLLYCFVLMMPIATEKSVTRFLRPLLLFLCSALVIATFSKIAMATLVVITAFKTVRSKNLCVACAISRIFVLGLLFCFVLIAKNDPQSMQKRLLLLQHGAAILKTHVLWGTGLGQYVYAEGGLQTLYPYFFVQPVHNILLLFMCEAGLVLGGSLLFFLFKYGATHIKNRIFIVCLLAILLTGFFDHYWLTLQQNWLGLGVFLGLALNPWFVEQ